MNSAKNTTMRVMRFWFVVTAIIAFLLTGAYFLRAMQMDCGGWAYSGQCPPLTGCVTLPGRVTCQAIGCAVGQCLPIVVIWVFQLEVSPRVRLSPASAHGKPELSRRNESVPILDACAVPKTARMTEIVSKISGLRLEGSHGVRCLAASNYTGALT